LVWSRLPGSEQQIELNHRNLLVVATSLSLGLGVEAVPEVIQPLPEILRLLFSSAVTTGGVVALILNTLMPQVPAAPGSEQAAQLDVAAAG
jgi:xanthine permease XanP